MSSFLFASFVGFLLHWVLREVQVTTVTDRRSIKLSNFAVISMKAQDFKRLRLTMVIILLLCLFLVVVKVVHPNDLFIFGYLDLLTSPIAASTIFGASFGWIAGSVTSRLLRESNDYVFSYKDWMQIGTLLLVLILGIGGEDFVRSFGRRINKLAFAGAEVSFAGSESKSSNQLGRGPGSIPAGDVATSFKAFNGSLGLSLADDAADNLVDRDEGYIKLFLHGKVRGGRFQDFDRQKYMLQKAIRPLVSCLVGTYNDGSGISDLNSQISGLITPIQRLRDLHGPEHVEFQASSQLLAEASNVIVGEAYNLAASKQQDPRQSGTPNGAVAPASVAATQLSGPRNMPAECDALVDLLCPAPAANDPAHLPSDEERRKNVDACLARTATERRDDATLIAASAGRFRTALSPSLPGTQQDPALSVQHLHELLIGPYMTIEYASLSAQLGRYEAAAHALQTALNAPSLSASIPHSGASTADVAGDVTEDKAISEWSKIRLRASLASVVEEWIANRPGVPPTLVQFHIRNFDQTILLYEDNTFIQGMVKQSGHLNPRILESFASAAQDFGTCGWDDARKSLFGAYVGAILSYLDFALSDEEFRVDNSGLIAARADFVNDLNLHCLDPATRTLMRAEGLLQWARAQTNGVRIAGDLKSSTWAGDRLDKATDAARLAENTIYSDYLKAKNDRKNTTDALFAVQGSEVLHLWGQIRSVQAEIGGLRQ